MMTTRTDRWMLALAVGLGLLSTRGTAAESPKEKGKEMATYLGVAVAKVDATVRAQLKLERGVGLAVQEVTDDSPASKAGLKQHDVLEKLNDQVLYHPEQLTGLVRGAKPGDKVTLTYWRQGKSEKTEATLGEKELGELPENPLEAAFNLQANLSGSGAHDPFQMRLFGQTDRADRPRGAFLGVVLQPVEDSLSSQLGLKDSVGALVGEVIENSPAEKAGVKKHDVIIKLDDKELKGDKPAEQFSERIQKHKRGDKVTLDIVRGGKSLSLEATLAERDRPDPKRVINIMRDFKVLPKVEIIRPGPGDAALRQLNRSLEILRRTDPTHREVNHGAAQSRVMVVKSDEGTITVKDAGGVRHVVVTDPEGKVTFEGPADTQEQKEKLPADVRKRLDRLDEAQELKSEPGKEIEELRLEQDAPSPRLIRAPSPAPLLGHQYVLL